MQVLSYPLRLQGGRFASVELGTEDHVRERLAVLLLTRRGERPLVPLLGVLDPTYDQLDLGDLIGQVELFGPPVRIDDVVTTFPRDGEQSIEVIYT